MSMSDGREGGAWRGRFAAIGLVFGIAELAWNAWVISQLISGADAVRPGLVVQIVLQVGGGLLLIGLAVQFRRRPPR
jgi:apolipoprotein N-acyltransferase